MIWLWLLARERHKWQTGALDRYFEFLCAHCAVTTAAMVRTFGFGSGSSPEAAQRSAQLLADAQAYRAVAAAACPHCSQVQPAMHEQFATVAKKVARRLARRLPVAAAVTVVLAVLFAIIAVPDLRYSVTLPIAALTAAVAVGALVYAVFSHVVVLPSTNPMGVWFSRDPSQGSASWFPARGGDAPVITQASSRSRGISHAVIGVAVLATVLAVVLWTATFRKVYVVSAEGPDRALTFRVDDGERTSVAQGNADDAPNAMVEVRTSSVHRVAVVDSDGIQSTYVLDPSASRHGWVIAPHAPERGLCLASIKWYYGVKPPKDGDDALLGQQSELVPLPHDFDHVFTAPPSTVQTQNGASETRTSLRALDCAALEREVIVPFKSAVRRVAPDAPPPTAL